MVREIADHKEAIARLCRDLGVERLFLFGSATRGSTLADVRDLDFLVRFRPMPPVEYAHNYFRLAEQLEALLEAPVDLVELDSIRNPYFKEAMDETKVPVYEIAWCQEAALRCGGGLQAPSEVHQKKALCRNGSLISAESSLSATVSSTDMRIYHLKSSGA